MITIVHVIGTLEIGGAQVMLWKVVSESDRERFRHVVVCAFEEGPFAERLRAIDVPVYDLRMRHGNQPPGFTRRMLRLLKAPVAVVKLLALLRRIQPDMVLTWGYHVDVLGLFGAKLVRVPVVWTVFSSFNPYFGRFVTSINKVAVRLSSLPAAVVTDSQAGRRWHSQLGYRPQEWQVIHNGFDVEQFAPDESARRAIRLELGLPDDALLIGLVARFNPVKGHQTFLEAAGLLAREMADPHFVLTGPEVNVGNELLGEWIRERGIVERVHLLGERPDVPRVTAALDIATCASYGESFPIVVGEAMACGVPCVVTDVGDAASMVADTGRVVPPRDAQAMATAWRELIELGAAERKLLGAQARLRVEENYSMNSIVREYDELCARVANRSGTIVRRS
jgi:glycosyltransferase involved in cell wall biosynthesis